MLCIQGTKQAALLYTGWPGYNRLRQTESNPQSNPCTTQQYPLLIPLTSHHPQLIPTTSHHPQLIPPTSHHPQLIPQTSHHPQLIPPTSHHLQLIPPTQLVPPTSHHPQLIPPTSQHPLLILCTNILYLSTISTAHHTYIPCSSYAPTSYARPQYLLLIPLISPAHHQSSSATSTAHPKISPTHTNSYVSHPSKIPSFLPTTSTTHPHNIHCLTPVIPRNIHCSS
jgi:hypothetical protein